MTCLTTIYARFHIPKPAFYQQTENFVILLIPLLGNYSKNQIELYFGRCEKYQKGGGLTIFTYFGWSVYESQPIWGLGLFEFHSLIYGVFRLQVEKIKIFENIFFSLQTLISQSNLNGLSSSFLKTSIFFE